MSSMSDLRSTETRTWWLERIHRGVEGNITNLWSSSQYGKFHLSAFILEQISDLRRRSRETLELVHVWRRQVYMTGSGEMKHESALERWRRFTYVDNLPEDIGPFRKLLEEYSNIPPEAVDGLLLRTREKLWEVAMYPCIGRWSFLNLQSVRDPHFYTAVERLRGPAASGAASTYPEALLDLGCCVGQLLRKLVHDGIEPTRLFGTDLHSEFISIGAELFRDEANGLTFVAGDMLDPNDEALGILDGKITLVHAGNFFHLFTWEEQVVWNENSALHASRNR
ncbi:hypothetical protein MKX08_001004 [Trichoderma sp. CBMAI-0020]|nr:hypothetical protein MKX08_001004 [Trichoderma sp. CBMAI-0020]